MSALRNALLLARFSCLFGAAAIFLAGSARAQAVRVDLDPAHTQVEFTLGATLHTVHGTFRLKSGTIAFDEATGKASGEIVIDATSGNTVNDGRDSKMHKTVLESAQYPEVVFEPQQVNGRLATSGTSNVQVQGVIRLHGSEHTITLPVETQIASGQIKATASFAIPYVQWGLKDPSTFVLRVEKSVQIKIQAVGTVEAPR